MTKNMGIVDRRIRAFVVAPLLLLAAWLFGFASVLGMIAVVLAVVMIATSLVGTCPLYAPVHVDTRSDGEKADPAA